MSRALIPRHYHILDYVIKVKVVTDAEVRRKVGRDAAAGWIGGDMTIYLGKERTLAQKRLDLTHELLHALVDLHDIEHGRANEHATG